MKALTLLIPCLGLFAACSLEKDPFDGIKDDDILAGPEGWNQATLGNYSLLKEPDFTRNYFTMGEYGSDNVSLSGTTADPFFFSYNYQHVQNQNNTLQFWRKAYQAIAGCNKVLEVMPEGQDPETDQLIGENLFIRAFAHLSLCRVFGRPYSQDPETNPGIPVSDQVDVNLEPARNTVQEVYDFIVSDLQKAIPLMGSEKANSYASKEVAMALLARVYLYMNENEQARDYADSVIQGSRYTMLATEALPSYFTQVNESNPETIWAIRHTTQDDREWASIGSMYYQSPGGLGYGEMYASESYRDLIDTYEEDARREFIIPVYLKAADGSDSLNSDGERILETRNGFPKYFITKFSNQEGIPTLSSPVVLRLAEMYLIRAEANAKLGNAEEALEDVNRIRSRAGLAGDALYSTSDLKGHSTVLDVVLEERRLELAFEAERTYDLFRNNRDLVRDYPGTHQQVGQDIQTIEHTSPRVVHYLPEAELVLNPNLEQNP